MLFLATEENLIRELDNDVGMKNVISVESNPIASNIEICTELSTASHYFSEWHGVQKPVGELKDDLYPNVAENLELD